jgi:hydroxyacylglutathione hydrolase
VEQGWEQEHLEQVTAAELAPCWRSGATIIDVRSDAEWAAGHIEGARHIMGGDLPKQFDDLPRDTTLHLICATGYRSSIAASVLRRAGFSDLANVADGMDAWQQRGLPVATGT